jgi:hypothetical protein
MNLPEIFSGPITQAKWRELGRYLTGGVIRGGPGLRVRNVGGNTIISRVKSKTPGSSSSASGCSFGEIIDVDDGTYTKAILGGAMLCGDQNFNIENHGIDLTSAGSWLVQITLTGIDPATDDDDEIFLSGVVTASGTPAWGTVTYTGSEDYTANTNPATPAGTGTIVIPIGVLVVADGAATLTPVGCGTITVGHCAGILSHQRG